MPTAPRDLTVEAVASGSMALQWSNETKRGEIYASIHIEFDNGSGWTSLPQLTGDRESYYATVLNNLTYIFRLRGRDRTGAYSDYSNTAQATSWTDTLTETVTCTDATVSDARTRGNMLTETVTCTDVVTDSGVFTDVLTETVTCSDYVAESKSISTNYGYYLGDADGKIYEYDESYKSDNGTSIEGYWQSKQTDFSDQNQKCKDAYKSVYKARLHYVDLDADTVISVLVSTDGGTTWTSVTKTVGTGDETVKSKDYHFRKYGQYFTFRISNASTDKLFQFVHLEVEYEVLGRVFII